MRRRLADLRVCLLLAMLAFAAGAGARTSDRNQPLNVQADTTDCTVVGDGACSFTGNVHMVQGTLDLRAGKAVVHRVNGDIRRVTLTGNQAQLAQQLDDGSQVNARADNVDYDLSSDTVVFTGNAFIDQPGRGNIAGGRISYNTKSGQVQGSGQGQDRVKMQFQPKNSGAAGSR